MFFPERIRSIRPTDRVLDVGPGAYPHPAASVYLERRFETEAEAHAQRGRAPALADPARVVYYDGGRFPFADQEFDYVVCSHVLEHVDDVEFFTGELQRVARRGYLEFPTVYYEYLYDFPEHQMLLAYREGHVRWMPKLEAGFSSFKPITSLLRESLDCRHTALVDALRGAMVDGFEWNGTIRTQRAISVSDLALPCGAFRMPAPLPGPHVSLRRRLADKLRRILAHQLRCVTS